MCLKCPKMEIDRTKICIMAHLLIIKIVQPLRRGIVIRIASDLHHNFIPLVHEVEACLYCIGFIVCNKSQQTPKLYCLLSNNMCGVSGLGPLLCTTACPLSSGTGYRDTNGISRQITCAVSRSPPPPLYHGLSLVVWCRHLSSQMYTGGNKKCDTNTNPM